MILFLLIIWYHLSHFFSVGGTVHATILKDNIVKDYREEQRGQAHQALNGYMEICTRAEVSDESIIISFGWHALVGDNLIVDKFLLGSSRETAD